MPHGRPADADIVDSDDRALQAAVDYVGNRGGGVVETGSGEHPIPDSLSTRRRVAVNGAGEEKVLEKDRARLSPLAAAGSARVQSLTGCIGFTPICSNRASIRITTGAR